MCCLGPQSCSAHLHALDTHNARLMPTSIHLLFGDQAQLVFLDCRELSLCQCAQIRREVNKDLQSTHNAPVLLELHEANDFFA